MELLPLVVRLFSEVIEMTIWGEKTCTYFDANYIHRYIKPQIGKNHTKQINGGTK